MPMPAARELPSASVVVPVFNGAATIGDMLRALCSQARSPSELELIVVDNGSTDQTREVVGRYDVTLLEEPTRGPSAARNRGLRHATGEIVVHLDADTVPTRDWLASILEPFVDATVVLAAGQCLSFPPQTPPERYLSRFQLYDAEKNIHRAVLPFVASMNMAVRRSAAEAVGGWAEDMPTSEDVDFCTRVLRQFPRPIAYAPKALLFHRNRDTEAGLQKQAWTYGEGVADTYRRYPGELHWGLPQYLRLGWYRLWRATRPAVLGAGRVVGLGSDEAVEYARYHLIWTRWFWRGFFSFYRSGTRRSG